MDENFDHKTLSLKFVTHFKKMGSYKFKKSEFIKYKLVS
jgi:hypothetical protein